MLSFGYDTDIISIGLHVAYFTVADDQIRRLVFNDKEVIKLF